MWESAQKAANTRKNRLKRGQIQQSCLSSATMIAACLTMIVCSVPHIGAGHQHQLPQIRSQRPIAVIHRRLPVPPILPQSRSYTMRHLWRTSTGHLNNIMVRGAVSTYGPPVGEIGPTAYSGNDAQAGIAVNPGAQRGSWDGPLARSLAHRWFLVRIGHHQAFLRVIDKGPSALATSGPDRGQLRALDITGAGLARLGYHNQAQFPTDTIGSAREWSGSRPPATH
jgi:hypothetical protein